MISIRKMESVLECFLLSVLFLGFTNVFSTAAGKLENSYPIQTVSLGENFTLTCKLDVFDFIKWFKDGRPIVPDLYNLYAINETRGNTEITTTLHAAQAKSSHSGRYRCSPFMEEELFLFVLNEDSISMNYDPGSTKYKILELGAPLEIHCNTTESDVRLEWYKDDKNITDSKGRVKIKDYKLVIEKSDQKDAGNYTCKAIKTKVNGTIVVGEKVMEVGVKAQVGIIKDLTVVEGEKLSLECMIYGSSVKISWKFGNDTYTESTDRVKLEEHGGFPNAALVIKEARMEDRGYYTCIGTSGNSTAEAQCYVRIKDKLAALWPFLGICVEVIVLCAIILIYEKKRNKTEMEESDTDNSPETKNTPDHGKDSVRQRK